jgi:hypothetical protein
VTIERTPDRRREQKVDGERAGLAHVVAADSVPVEAAGRLRDLPAPIIYSDRERMCRFLPRTPIFLFPPTSDETDVS